MKNKRFKYFFCIAIMTIIIALLSFSLTACNINGGEHTQVITYKLGYGNNKDITQDVRYGDYVSLLKPNRNGYNFKGWYNDGQLVTDGKWQYTTDVTLTAEWEIINCNITYHTNDGVFDSEPKTTFNVRNLNWSLQMPYKENYNFVGWYENVNFEGEPVDMDISKLQLKDYELYAKYTDEPVCELELSADGIYYSVSNYDGKLQYISIPKNYNGKPIKKIAPSAFENCNSLKYIEIPDSIDEIGDRAFYGCTKLESISILNNIKSIGNYTFYNCSNLTNVILSNSIESIGNYAFYGCKGLASVSIPNNLKRIENFTFYNCSNLTNITMSNSVESIGDYAFYGCTELASLIIPNSVTSIGYRAFCNCINLISIKIPNSVTIIDAYAFCNCSKLTSVTILDGITKIGACAFSSCSSLTDIVIPNSVTSIGNYAFSGCNELTKVYYKGSSADWNNISIDLNNSSLTNAKRYYYSESEPLLNESGTGYNGNYWHYVGGVVTIWSKENK